MIKEAVFVKEYLNNGATLTVRSTTSRFFYKGEEYMLLYQHVKATKKQSERRYIIFAFGTESHEAYPYLPKKEVDLNLGYSGTRFTCGKLKAEVISLSNSAVTLRFNEV